MKEKQIIKLLQIIRICNLQTFSATFRISDVNFKCRTNLIDSLRQFQNQGCIMNAEKNRQNKQFQYTITMGFLPVSKIISHKTLNEEIDLTRNF